MWCLTGSAQAALTMFRAGRKGWKQCLRRAGISLGSVPSGEFAFVPNRKPMIGPAERPGQTVNPSCRPPPSSSFGSDQRFPYLAKACEDVGKRRANAQNFIPVGFGHFGQYLLGAVRKSQPDAASIF